MIKENSDIFYKHESNVRSYCRSFPAVLDKAEGSFVYDENGNKYLDFFSGAGALNYGHNHPILRSALIEYLQGSKIGHSLDFYTTAKREFIKKFNQLILEPRKMDYKLLFPGLTGTNSIEAAIKIARKFTGRSHIAAFTNAFHGMTLGSLSLTGNLQKREGAGAALLLAGVDRYLFDGYLGNDFSTVDLIDKLLQDPSSGFTAPAAFIVETVQAEGGVNTASHEWLKQLSKIAKKYGSLLIIDDIQAGCGRTGSFFSFDDMDIQPDIVCLSKSLSGYGQPLSLVLVSPKYDIFEPGQHNGTFRGNNLAFVTAGKALEFWADDKFLLDLNTNISLLNDSLKKLVAVVGDNKLKLKA